MPVDPLQINTDPLKIILVNTVFLLLSKCLNVLVYLFGKLLNQGPLKGRVRG